MHIAINNSLHGYANDEVYAYYTRSLSKGLIDLCPGDSFSLLCDRLTVDPLSAPNTRHILLKPAARHPLLWKYWYDVKLPSALKKAEADVFLSPFGLCSLQTDLPQVIVIHDLSFIHSPGVVPAIQRWYYKLSTPAFFQKAKKIITVSEFSKANILTHFPFTKNKIEVVPFSPDTRFVPADDFVKASVKEKYTAGREFFLFAEPIHQRCDVISLLKAFSNFKKRQHTNMQLVISGSTYLKQAFSNTLPGFKYRNDVLVTGRLGKEEMALMMASAYATVYPPLFEGFSLPVLESMRCGVPVLCSGNSSLTETAGDAALYFNPSDPEDITKQMALVYKDESFRAKMINKGYDLVAKYSWEKTAGRLREILEDAVNSSSIP